MTTQAVRSGFDSWVNSLAAGEEHGDDKALHLQVPGGATRYSFVHLAVPAPPGAIIQTAKLRLFARGASTTTRTVTARRAAASWKAKTLNYNNKPGVTGATNSVVIGTLADKDMIEIDVTADVQAIQGGAVNNGWRIETTGTGDHKVYAFDGGVKPPTLVVTYVEAPDAPTNLRPGGGLVGVARPVLQWQYNGDEDQASYTIQVDPAANGVTPAYTATVSSSDPIHLPTSDILASTGSVTQWRVLAVDAAGQTSVYSDWVTITRDDKGTGAITNPAAPANNFVQEPTPPITFTLSGETLAAFEVIITPSTDRSNELYSSGKVSSGTGTHTLPKNRDKGGRLLQTGDTYSVIVRMFDTKKRQGSTAVGDEPYVEVIRDFTVQTSGTVTAPVAVSIVADATPAPLFTFTRATAPDAFVIVRDGKELESGLLPVDIFLSGSSYVWRDWKAKPGVAHAYKVRAVVNGVQSNDSNTVTLTPSPSVEGLWVVDNDTGLYFVCSGLDVGDWEHLEVGADFLGLGARAGFRITQVMGGLSGSFKGLLNERTFATVATMETNLWRLKEVAPHSPDLRLITDKMNIPVQIANLSCTVSEDSVSGYPRRNVKFRFWQTGEYDFEGRV